MRDPDFIRAGRYWRNFKGKRNGAPEEIRTPDPQIRSLVLYPAELRVRLSAVCPASSAACSAGVAIL